MYVEGKAHVKDLLTVLSGHFEDGGWEVVSHQEANAMQDERLVVKTTTTPPEGSEAQEGITRFLIFDRAKNDYKGFRIRLSDGWDNIQRKVPEDGYGTHEVRLDFFPYKDYTVKSSTTYRTTTGGTSPLPTKTAPDQKTGNWIEINFDVEDAYLPGLKDTTIIYYYMSIDNNKVMVCLEGDPALNLSYDRRITWMYAGRIIPFNNDDIEGNFALTAGANFKDAVRDNNYENGEWDEVTRIYKAAVKERGYSRPINEGWPTATGNYDIMMWKTYSGLPIQEHHASTVTHRDDIALSRFNASNWTSKYYMSPIYVVHGEDGFRGYLDGVMAVHNQSIVHRDKLIVKDDKDPDVEKHYKYFNVNVEKSIIQDLANKEMGLAFYQYDREAAKSE